VFSDQPASSLQTCPSAIGLPGSPGPVSTLQTASGFQDNNHSNSNHYFYFSKGIERMPRKVEAKDREASMKVARRKATPQKKKKIKIPIKIIALKKMLFN
jgi:hypothetical protein